MDSPSNRDGRRVLYGYTGDGATAVLTTLQATLLIRDLWTRLEHLPGIALGHTMLIQDPGALVIEYSEPDAIATLPDFWDQLILLTSSKGVLITSLSATAWERLLTAQAEAQQQAATMGGDFGDLPGPARCSIHVQIKGDTGTDPSTITEHLIKKLVECIGVAWSAATLGELTRAGQIAPVAGHVGSGSGHACAHDSIVKMLNGLCFAGAAGTRQLGVTLQHDYADRTLGRGREVSASIAAAATRETCRLLRWRLAGRRSNIFDFSYTSTYLLNARAAPYNVHSRDEGISDRADTDGQRRLFFSLLFLSSPNFAMHDAHCDRLAFTAIRNIADTNGRFDVGTLSALSSFLYGRYRESVVSEFNALLASQMTEQRRFFEERQRDIQHAHDKRVEELRERGRDVRAALEASRMRLEDAEGRNASLEGQIAGDAAAEEVARRQVRALEALNRKFSGEQRRFEDELAGKERRKKAEQQRRGQEVEELQGEIRELELFLQMRRRCQASGDAADLQASNMVVLEGEPARGRGGRRGRRR
ncbi:unnamed protein product [Prorocentrum cordatum]|uniref:Uncharacterized protein n=1 Tax=Prorocentrum cordatum TaxID=2364126 RepID=A0ABN9XQP4_9DINO|nr:unnamed protein product [Polarella glacialis]